MVSVQAVTAVRDAAEAEAAASAVISVVSLAADLNVHREEELLHPTDSSTLASSVPYC